MYNPYYRASHALVIGINEYAHCSRLACARADAEAVAASLVAEFGFEQDRVILLLDEQATKARIMSAYLSFAGDAVEPDDKVLVFFAGHGHTVEGKRGEVGFLVPVDGMADDLGTLIRWDEFSRNADLIDAKHILYIMDACYSGLAFKRAVGPGAARFLTNMLQRFSRQVIAAGKADEQVADAGGPRAGHSMFTGHLLDALGGGAERAGVMTGNGVMNYVYDRVGSDPHSTQTPHYGCVEGDGDFIFKPLSDAVVVPPPEIEQEPLVVLPGDMEGAGEPEMSDLVQRLKADLSDPTRRIWLDDLIRAEVRRALAELEAKQRDNNATPIDAETVSERIAEYDESIRALAVCFVLIGRWAKDGQGDLLEDALVRVAEASESSGGYPAWIGLRWYPASALFHYAAIAALSAENYDVVARLFRARMLSSRSQADELLFVRMNNGVAESHDAFKQLAGYERKYVPRSEYMHATLQPLLEDLLYLGRSYERLFDRFEVLNALAHVDSKQGWSDWGPPGRFAWKARQSPDGPFKQLVEEANAQGSNWPPLVAGMFGGSVDRFTDAVSRFKEVLKHFQFH